MAAPLAGESATDYGTGIVLTSGGEVLTNNHVIEGAKSVSVTDIGNGRTYHATVVGYGDSVVGIGNACGTGGTPSVASGTVTALDRSVSPTDEATGAGERLTGMIKTNADIQEGDSGGPLVNGHGQVIGMDTAASSGSQCGNSSGGSGGTEAGTPASSAGLTGGAVITSIAGQRVSSYASIQQALERYHPGDKISVAWTGTDGQSHTGTLTLASGPAA